MNKKTLSGMLLPFLLLSVTLPVLAQPPNPYLYTVASIGDPDTLDPAKCYDQASGILLFNVYETLVFWDKDNLEKFVGLISENVPEPEDDSGYTGAAAPYDVKYTFRIREGIPWQDPAYGTVTAEDVEYSIERVLVLDYTGGPEWMLYEPLLNCHHADLDDPLWMQKIDDAVTVDGNEVTLHLTLRYPAILHVLSNVYGGSILCKQWCIDGGDWDGTHTQEALLAVHDPADPWMDVLDHSHLTTPRPHLDAAMGCGPYMLDYWDHGIEWSLIKFDAYWRGWPCPDPRRGWIERYTYKKIEEWAARREGFKAGTYDNVYVPTEHIGEVEGFCDGGGCIECRYPFPSMGTTCMFFGFNVSTASPYLGVPGGLPYGTLDESGIPPDFFSDIHVRKAFAYCVDYDTIIEEALLGEAERPTSPLCKGLVPDFRNPDQPVYNLDLEAAEAEFKLAYGGELWTTGFTCGVAYNTGNPPRETICDMLKTYIETLNPKFHIDKYGVDWGSVYIPQLLTFQLNMFIMGWGADYPDAHNFMFTFMHKYGDFGYFQRLDYETVDDEYVYDLLMEALTAPTEEERREKYFELQEIYYDNCISVPTWDPLARRWQRDWIQGWFYNAIYPGSYAYVLWKEILIGEDLNEDGRVDIRDITTAAMAFGSYYEVRNVHERWDSTADINRDRKVDIRDITLIAMKFGYSAPPWTPP